MFFIRRYVKGNHQSGTKNVFEWDERPSIMDFIYTCEAVGEGKYVLFERGVGIRGMRKINEYTVKLSENVEKRHAEVPVNNGDTVRSNENREPSIAEMVVFAAEEMGVDSDTILAVKKNMKMSDLSDDELVRMLEQVSDTEVASAEGFGKYQGDLKALLKEFKKRATDMTLEAPKSSSNKLNMMAMFTAGGVVGTLATAGIYKKKITDMEERFGALEASMAETEKTVKKQADEMKKKEKSAEAVRQFDSRIGMDAQFLNTFNNNNGPQF